MFRKIRESLPSGSAQVLLACAAIAWGLGRLQVLADERQAQLDRLEAATAAAEGALRGKQEEFIANTYVDDIGYRRWRYDGEPVLPTTTPSTTTEGTDPE